MGIPLTGLALYGLWQLASALWSHDTALALDEYDRTLLYVLAFALFGSLPRNSQRLQWLIRALAVGMTAVCLAALVSRVLPHVWPTTPDYGYSRLNYPLTYWNAVGLMAAIATILLFHLASSAGEHPWVRVLGAMLIPATATTLLLTFSRGAILVAIVGLLIYAVLGRPSRIGERPHCGGTCNRHCRPLSLWGPTAGVRHPNLAGCGDPGAPPGRNRRCLHARSGCLADAPAVARWLVH